MSTDILKIASELVNGDRRESYGSVREDFSRIARLWTIVLGHECRAEHVPLMMICVKLSREIHAHKLDNLVDIAGYAQTLATLVDNDSKGG